jgi:hypothetical protein
MNRRAMRTPLNYVWQFIAILVFLFGGWVAFELSTGDLDPLGSPLYGVGVSWRESALFLLLGGLQGVALVDAVALCLRRRVWTWWLGLAAGAAAIPLLMVVTIAQVDIWRAAQRSALANLSAGFVMALLLALTYVTHLRVWAASRRHRKQPSAR